MAVRMAGPDRLARSSRMTTTALTPPGSQTAPAPARLGPGPAGSAVPNCPGPCPSRSWPSRLCGAGPLARTLDRSVPASAERAVARCQRASAPLEQARRSAGTTLSPLPPSEPQPGARRRPRILLAQRRTKSEGGLVRRELPAERPAACRPSDLESVSGVESGRSRAISPQSPRRNPDCDSIHLNSRWSSCCGGGSLALYLEPAGWATAPLELLQAYWIRWQNRVTDWISWPSLTSVSYEDWRFLKRAEQSNTATARSSSPQKDKEQLSFIFT